MHAAGAAFPVVRAAGLELAPGEAIALVGASGVGKSTLLHAISGLIPWSRPGRVDGAIEVDGEPVDDLDPGQRAHLLATCLDRPDAQLFLATPRDELEASRRLWGDGPMLGTALDLLDVRRLLDRRTISLSSGERQRVALVLALAAVPRPVLLDEPTANLDGAAAAALGDLIARAGRAGGAVLAAEQAPWRLASSFDRWLRLHRGLLEPEPAWGPPGLPAPRHPPGSRVVLEARGVAVARGGVELLRGVGLVLCEGEVVLLTGLNGAGKSSLVEVLAGARRPAAGAVTRRGRTALTLANAELQLLAATVSDEIAAAGGWSEQSRVLRRHNLDHLAARAPWSLSRGERQRLVHASLDVLRPDVMLLDEPAQGLDPDDLVDLVDRIHRRAEKGRAYLIVSHREELAAAAHRHLRIEHGRLTDAGGSRGA